jgi:hypothetical protein
MRSDRPFLVYGKSSDGGCKTHCGSLKGAERSAKGFAPCYTSLVIYHNGEMVKVIR